MRPLREATDGGVGSDPAAGESPGGPRRMLVLGVSVWALVSVVTFLLPPLLPEIRESLSITNGQAGIALTVLYVTYGVFQYPSGQLSDEWNHATLIFPAIVVLGVATFLIGASTGLVTFVLACGCLGLGRGLFSIPMRLVLTELFPVGKGKALGYFNAGTDVGGIVAAGVAILVLSVGTWTAPFVVLAGLLVGLSGLFLLWSHEPWLLSPREVYHADLAVAAAIKRISTTPGLRRLLVAFSLFSFMVNGVLNFLPEYLQEAKSMSPQLAGSIYALLFVLGIVVKPTSGSLSDRFDRRTVSIVGMVVSAASLCLLLVSNSIVVIAILVASFTVGYKTQFPVIDAMLVDGAPEASRGRDLGAARAVFHAFGATGPAFVGLVADRFSFTAAFVALTICLLSSAALLWRR